MTSSRLKPKQKRLESCDLEAPKRAKFSKNGMDDTRGPFKIAGFVGHDAGNLENTGKILQSSHNIKLLGKYPFRVLPVTLKNSQEMLP